MNAIGAAINEAHGEGTLTVTGRKLRYMKADTKRTFDWMYGSRAEAVKAMESLRRMAQEHLQDGEKLKEQGILK